MSLEKILRRIREDSEAEAERILTERQKKAEEIKSRLVQRNKKALILIMDEITNEKLLGLKLDAFINTACPRLAYDLNGVVIDSEDLEL